MKHRGGMHIPSLDGIRAIAASLVFVAHAGLEDLVPGGFGVTIFFFLSGYLITTLLRMEFDKDGDISLRKFYLRRIFRIWPPMYIALAVAAIPPFVIPASIHADAVLAQALHLTNYYIIFFGLDHIIPTTGPMWSLAVEEHFYLLYPLVLILLLRKLDRRKAAGVLLVACAVVLVWRCILVYFIRYGHDYTYLASDARFDSLLYGCTMGLALNPYLDKQEAMSQQNWIICMLAGIALLLFALIYRNPEFRESFRYSIQGIGLFPLFYCAIRYSQWPIFSWLELPGVRGFGIVTYTFYLVHWKALDVTSLFIHNALLHGVVGFALALAFSAMLYFLVERRMADLRRRLHT